MTRMIVGVDGSTAGDAALRWSAALAAATDAELTAVHAFHRPYAEVPVDEYKRMLAERREIVDQWIRPAAAAGAKVRGLVIEGDPRPVLAEAADKATADLLVLGRTGRGGGPGFLHLGSVVEHAAHGSARALAVIPSDATTPIRRIVLGVDGSPAAEAATEWCARVAAKLGAEVVMTTVFEPVLEWTPSWDDRNWRRSAERDLLEWSKPLADAGVETHLVPVENLYPADGLLGLAAGRAADLLVIGTRGKGGFPGLRFGGVAMKVLHRASLPLVLVPPVA